MNPLRQQLWALKLTHPQREIVAALLEFADGAGGNAGPGVPLLAHMTDYSERQVQRLLRELEDTGIVTYSKPHPRRPNVYAFHPEAGEYKPPFQARSGDAILSPHNNASGDIASGMSPQTGTGDAVLSPQDAVTGHGGIDVAGVTDECHRNAACGDTPSADLSSISLSLSTDSLTPGESFQEPERESVDVARVRDGEQSGALAQIVEASAVYQAFARGWDGIAPTVEALFAQSAYDASASLQAEISAGRLTLAEIEAVTRWKLAKPRSSTYQIGYVKGDLAGYRAWFRAQAQQARGSPDADGQKYVNGKYADFIEH